MPGGNEQFDIGVARLPRVAEKIAARRFEMARRFIPEIIEGAAQRSAPCLIPPARSASMATTITGPAPQAVRATPGRPLTIEARLDLHLYLGRLTLKALAVIGAPKPAPRRLDFEGIGQTHLAMAEVMAVSLSISRHVDDPTAPLNRTLEAV